MNDYTIGGTVPPNTAMPQQAPDYMQPPQQPQQSQQSHIQQSNASSFSLDRKALEILGSVHPELVNAMVGLAIKKFACSDDYLNYFVRDELKAQAEQQTQAQVGTQPQQQQSQKASAISFNEW